MLRISFCLYFFITNFRIMANTLSLEYFVGIWLCWFFWCKFTMLKVIFMKKQVEQKSFEGKGQRLKAGIWGHNIEISWRKVFLVQVHNVKGDYHDLKNGTCVRYLFLCSSHKVHNYNHSSLRFNDEYSFYVLENGVLHRCLFWFSCHKVHNDKEGFS